MYCKNCGGFINNTSVCPHCGISLTGNPLSHVELPKTENDLLNEQIELQKTQIKMMEKIGQVEIMNTQYTIFNAFLNMFKRR